MFCFDIKISLKTFFRIQPRSKNPILLYIRRVPLYLITCQSHFSARLKFLFLIVILNRSKPSKGLYQLFFSAVTTIPFPYKCRILLFWKWYYTWNSTPSSSLSLIFHSCIKQSYKELLAAAKTYLGC